MRPPLIDRLRCPRCRAERSFTLSEVGSNEHEVRSGSLTCSSCGHVARIDRGVVELMPDPPEFVRREAEGLARFADAMRADGWDRERVLRLPDDSLEYWQGQKAAMEHLLSTVDFEPGRSLLDVGSNTCWASNVFASRGLEVIALDISTAEMQGLDTADWWFEANGVYFERVLSTMFDPSIASGSLDYVFCCEVLHHNRKPELRRTLAELHRVLKPDGLLIVLSEPLRFPTNMKRDHGEEVAEYEGNENVYFFHEYLLAARRAGFSVEVIEPPTPAFTGRPLWLTAESSAVGSTKVFAQQLLRRSRPGRRLLLGYTMLLGPDAPLAMLCRKR